MEDIDRHDGGSYRDLLIWQKGLKLTKEIYEVSRLFPEDERFGLTAQIRRAAVSVPSNIAEGQARQGKKEFVRFLYIAKGSLAELDTQCALGLEFGYLEEKRHRKLLEKISELQRMIYSLIRKLSSSR